jgi:hypothetical protein
MNKNESNRGRGLDGLLDDVMSAEACPAELARLESEPASSGDAWAGPGDEGNGFDYIDTDTRR